MTSFYVELRFDLGAPDDPEGFEEHVELVTDAFADLEDVAGDVGANLVTGRVDLCMTVRAEDQAEAITRSVAAARTAIHCAGGSTPGWEKMLADALDDQSFSSRIDPSADTPPLIAG